MTAPNHLIAISTSTGIANLAIVQCDVSPSDSTLQLGPYALDVRYQFRIEDYKAQSAGLLPKLQQGLAELALQPSDIAALAVDIGPGGFTSLRTACGVAQGLCVAWNIPAVPVSSFEIMAAEQALRTGGFSDQPVTCVIDARLNELYCAQVQFNALQTQYIVEPHLLPVGQMGELSTQPQWLGDSGSLALAAQQGVLGGIQSSASAVGLAWLAWRELKAGRGGAAFDCQPMYVRNKVADTTSERLARKHGSA